MIITSPSFDDGKFIPKKFTCAGGDINPELQVQNVPAGAESLALIVDDPDASGGGVFVHWLVWNIDPRTMLIKEESIPPQATEGKNDGGRTGYMGPCPPPGQTHHYRFRLYALDAMLELSEDDTTAEDLLENIQKHQLEEAELVGLYKSDKDGVL